MTLLIDLGSRVARPGALPATGVKVPPPPELASEIRVDGVSIADADIRAEMQHHPAATGRQAHAEAATALVVRQLLLAEAARTGLAAVPETTADGRTEAADEAAIRTLLERVITTPRAEEAICRRYYNANPARFTASPIWEARHILIAASEQDVARRRAAAAAARRLAEELQGDPARFDELAREFSACPSRHDGGRLGQIGPGDTVPEFEAALADLAEGEITTDAIATRFGYHVIGLDRVVPARHLPFEVVRDRIADWLEAQSYSRAVAQYISLLARRARIEGIALPVDQQVGEMDRGVPDA